MTVLIVDDDPVSRHLYAKTLLRLKPAQDSVEVGSAEAALEWLKNDASATLIIMDTDLPGRMKGLPFFRFLRSNPRYAQIPVIVATGEAEEKQVKEAIDAGVRNFLVKPVRPALLTEKVTELLLRATPVIEAKFEAIARLDLEDETEYRFLVEKAETRLDELIARMRDAQDRKDLVERLELLRRFREPAALLGAGRLVDAVAVAGDKTLNENQRNSAFEMVLSEANILKQELARITRRV